MSTYCFFRQVIGQTLFALTLWVICLRPCNHTFLEIYQLILEKLCWNICLVVSNAMSRSEYVVLCEAVVYRPVTMSRALSRCFKNCENQTEQYCPFAWTVVIYFRLRCTSNWPWQSLHQGTQRVGSLCWCSPYRCILSTISLLSFLRVCSPSSYLILNPVKKTVEISLLKTNHTKNTAVESFYTSSCLLLQFSLKANCVASFKWK